MKEENYLYAVPYEWYTNMVLENMVSMELVIII